MASCEGPHDEVSMSVWREQITSHLSFQEDDLEGGNTRPGIRQITQGKELSTVC